MVWASTHACHTTSSVLLEKRSVTSGPCFVAWGSVQPGLGSAVALIVFLFTHFTCTLPALRTMNNWPAAGFVGWVVVVVGGGCVDVVVVDGSCFDGGCVVVVGAPVVLVDESDECD